MQLTLNGTPITVDPIAAEEIVRRYLLNGGDARPAHTTVIGIDLVSARQIDIKPGEKLIGHYAGPDGKTTVAILLPGEAEALTWKQALQWAKDQGGDLPNRVEALLLFQHHRDEFQHEVYWTNERHADVSSSAWFQSFLNGNQNYWHQDGKLMARAVRRVAIKPFEVTR